MTGYHRDGFCAAYQGDRGAHYICATVTRDWLDFTKSRGNDMETPNLQFGFKGLVPGDHWCICVSRWKEAFDAGKAPKVNLDCTDMHVVEGEYGVTIDMLKAHATDDSGIMHVEERR